MKGIYLGACKASHPNWNITYQDIDGTRDIDGDMLDTPLNDYDFIICTPPCNWWSRLNMVYWKSEYALRTRHLLPIMLIRLSKLGKPFIIECVRNDKRYQENYIFQICSERDIYIQSVGRHTYFTNYLCDLDCPQHQDFKKVGSKSIRVNDDGYNQGGSNVHIVIEKWLSFVKEYVLYEK